MDSCNPSNDVISCDEPRYPSMLMPWVVTGEKIIPKSELQPQQYYRTIPSGHGIAKGEEWQKMINSGAPLGYFISVDENQKQLLGAWKYIAAQKHHGHNFIVVEKEGTRTSPKKYIIWGLDDSGRCVFLAESPFQNKDTADLHLIYSFISDWEHDEFSEFLYHKIIPLIM